MADRHRIAVRGIIDVANVFLRILLKGGVLVFFSGEDDLLSPPQDTSTGLEEVMEQLNNSFPSTRGKILCSEAKTGS